MRTKKRLKTTRSYFKTLLNYTNITALILLLITAQDSWAQTPVSMVGTPAMSACPGENYDFNMAAEWTAGMPPAISGGTSSTFGDYTVYTFSTVGTNTGTFTTGNAALSIDYLVVGGGGSGGSATKGNSPAGLGGGGGGAGGVLSAINYSSLSASTNYNITIGSEGTGANTTPGYQNGGNSSFGGIATAFGGAGGASNFAAAPASPGGSGGGAGDKVRSSGGTQGNTGAVASGGFGRGGGGGGSNTAGTAGGTSAGTGGTGISNNITGTAIIYGAGGSGGGYNTCSGCGTQYTGSAGGSSGAGGAGGSAALNIRSQGGNATTYGSGGGGAAGTQNGGPSGILQGGNGMQGLVIIRFKEPKYTSSDPTKATVNATTGAVNIPPSATPGTVTITFKDASGATQTTTITITAVPSQPAFQAHSGNNYSIVPVAGVDYTWTGSGNFPSGNTGNSTTFIPATAGNLTVTPSNACGNGTSYVFNNPLPVTLASLTASCGKAVTLNWSTFSEQNSDKFVVETSTDANNWSYVTAFQAAGNSNTQIQYTATDDHRKSGISYYRLVQKDLNGQEKIYGPISVSCADQSESTSVYPNPANTQFTVQLVSNHGVEDAEITLSDITGKTILSRKVSIAEGSNQYLFDAAEFTMGTYIIRIESKEHIYQPIKIIKTE